jgi:hypothetical protein
MEDVSLRGKCELNGDAFAFEDFMRHPQFEDELTDLDNFEFSREFPI